MRGLQLFVLLAARWTELSYSRYGGMSSQKLEVGGCGAENWRERWLVYGIRGLCGIA